jgi:hypothetical protein
MTELYLIFTWLRTVTERRLAEAKSDERGEITEKVIITAIFAALAIGAGAVIVAKVLSKANSIPTN